MLFEAALGAYLVGSYIYHRLTEKKPKPPRGHIGISRNDEGAVFPLVYGKCRVRSPVLAWIGAPRYGPFFSFEPTNSAPLFFLAGIPFVNGTNRLHKIWVGDVLMIPDPNDATPLEDLDGNGGLDTDTTTGVSNPDAWRQDENGEFLGGKVEFLNGNSEQILVSGGVPVTWTAALMSGWFASNPLPGGVGVWASTGSVSLADIPGYRGHIGVCLYGLGDESGGVRRIGWSIGFGDSMPSFGFEISSYPEGVGLAGTRTVATFEANPADVIYDLLTGPMKLAIPFARVDIVSFTEAAETLNIEGLGFSRSFDEDQDADDTISEVLRHIDAVLYEDPTDLKIKIKLVRGDYDPATVPSFADGSMKILSYDAGGFSGTPNRIRVTYTDRSRNYNENSAPAGNLANAVGQDGEVRELQLSFLGCCSGVMAKKLAERELSARSRPMATCRISVSRAHWDIVPGMVVRLNHTTPRITDMLFRVGHVDRGQIEDGSIILELVQDFFYQYRGSVIPPPFQLPGSQPSEGS